MELALTLADLRRVLGQRLAAARPRGGYRPLGLRSELGPLPHELVLAFGCELFGGAARRRRALDRTPHQRAVRRVSLQDAKPRIRGEDADSQIGRASCRERG